MSVDYTYRFGFRFHPIVLGSVFMLLAGMAQAALTLQTERLSPYDLEVSAGLKGVPVGESRFIPWADIAALPSSTLTVEGEFVPGKQTVTLVMLADLWAALPVEARADTLLAYCTDGYFSIYQPDFLAEQKPFLVIKINELTPENWPPEGLSFDPGPYVISVSDQLAPGTRGMLDVNHKRPWGVDEIKFVALAEVEAPARSGPWTYLSPRGENGRELWLNSCSSCHPGPGGLAGGDKSQRPFEVLAAHAQYNNAYFRTYVRDPKSLVKGAKMEPHPHYTDEQLDALVAFITAEPAES